MAKKEPKTDFWVYELLKEANINLEPQGSTIKEIDEALKTASKRGTGKSGYPEFVGIVKDYLIVIEDKADMSKHKKLDGSIVSLEVSAVTEYAVNGALFYAKHLARLTTYKKILAFGVSGNAKKHIITTAIKIRCFNSRGNSGEYCPKRQRIVRDKREKGSIMFK